MGLIIVKKLDFGFRDNNLKLIIALPNTEDSYLTKFEVYTQDNIAADGDCFVPNEIDYIKAVQRAYDDCSEEEAFNHMFTQLSDTYIDDSGNEYNLYELKSDFYWAVAGKSVGMGIQVDRKNLTVIGMKLNIIGSSNTFTLSDECGEDSTVCVAALYDLLPLRLKVLEEAGTAISICKNSCELPRGFIDKLLLLKTIEMSLTCGKYCEALQYWNLFFNGNMSVSPKTCGCHGKNV